MDKALVKELIDGALAGNPAVFLVDWSISPDNDIKVWVDGDDGVDLEEIIRISRAIEHSDRLDREAEDFSLSVSTPGVDAPLKLKRQYVKNTGRTLSVETVSGEKAEGELTEAGEDAVTLSWSVREPKPVGKGRHTVVKTAVIPYCDIKKAVVKLKF